MTPLCFFDCSFKLPENLSAADTDGGANGSYGRGGIEDEDIPEIFGLEIPIYLLAAAHHEGIGNTCCSCSPESTSDFTTIIRRDQSTVKFVNDFFLVLIPIITGKERADHFDLIGKRNICRNTIFP